MRAILIIFRNTPRFGMWRKKYVCPWTSIYIFNNVRLNKGSDKTLDSDLSNHNTPRSRLLFLTQSRIPAHLEWTVIQTSHIQWSLPGVRTRARGQYSTVLNSANIYHVNLDKDFPVQANSQKIPYLPDWQLHRFMLFYIFTALSLYELHTRCTGTNFYPFIA